MIWKGTEKTPSKGIQQHLHRLLAGMRRYMSLRPCVSPRSLRTKPTGPSSGLVVVIRQSPIDLADSGFYAHTVVAACREMDVRFSITIRQRASLRDLIEAIPEEDWTPIPYWMDAAADVAETTYTNSLGWGHKGCWEALDVIFDPVPCCE